MHKPPATAFDITANLSIRLRVLLFMVLMARGILNVIHI